MTEQEHASQESASEEPGPKEGTDDATKSDMGFPGRPAQSATPVGQGEGPGAGVEDDSSDGASDDEDQ